MIPLSPRASRCCTDKYPLPLLSPTPSWAPRTPDVVAVRARLANSAMLRPSLKCKPMLYRATLTEYEPTSHKRALSLLPASWNSTAFSRHPSRFILLCCQLCHGISPPVVPSGICHPNSCLPWDLETRDSYYTRYLGRPAEPCPIALLLCLRMNLDYQTTLAGLLHFTPPMANAFSVGAPPFLSNIRASHHKSRSAPVDG